jgi:SpoVK/Ycf46/Vps4 family AAA+-type ATPase
MNIANFAGDDMHTFSEALVQAPAKSIVSVEDIDCVLGTSGNQRDKRGFAQLLSTLDAVTRKDPLIVCLTTNFPGGLDVAVRRRVDHCIEFKYATKAQAVALVTRFFPSFEDADALWSTLTNDGRRSIAMATLQKFLVRSMKYSSPWALLDDDPEAFTSLMDVVATESGAATMYL